MRDQYSKILKQPFVIIITSTAKRAQILSLRVSITPFKIVNPNPLIMSAISRNSPLSSQSICHNTKCNQITKHKYLIMIRLLANRKKGGHASITLNRDASKYLHKHLTGLIKILNYDRTDQRLRAHFIRPSSSTIIVIFSK